MYFIEKTKGRSLLSSYDFALFFAIIILTFIGIIVLSSATKAMSGGSYMFKQCFGIVIGLTAAIIISILDYRYMKLVCYIFYWLTIFLLVAVLFIGYGDETWGARSWIDLGFISFQPSEFAKIGFAMVMASCFEEVSGKREISLKSICKIAFYALLPMGLIMLQPDAGTLMVFAFMLICVIFISGIRYKHIIYAGICFLLSSPLLWFFVLGDHQKKRIISFISPGSDPSNATFQVDWAKMSVGSGKLWGQGLYNGILTQNNTVPIKESDFIFSVIGEELGFAGSIVVVFLVFFILYKCVKTANTSSDMYGRFAATAITGMMAFHFIENIGMNVGVLPVTGIPLPFVSYGGTAMISNYMAVGMLLSISRLRRKKINL